MTSPSTCTVSPISTGCLNTASPTRRSATTRSGSNGIRPDAQDSTSSPCAICSPKRLPAAHAGVDVLRMLVARERRERLRCRRSPIVRSSVTKRSPTDELVEVAFEQAHIGTSVIRNRVRSARRNAAAARRCPSGEGWKPSAA